MAGSKRDTITFPFYLSVLGTIYQVLIADDLTTDLSAIGYCNGETKRILLDSSLEGDYLIDVLFHEIVHAYQFESGLAETLDTQALEMMAQTLRAFLLATFSLKFKDMDSKQQAKLKAKRKSAYRLR